ncbi:tRNA U34 5-methylaminomethyl-2-thiouridine-forming methyltransferase MnmC [Nonlabens dokdonensis]|nr:tRNA U34 5-methylaminomethyl-2-thiouridine-forming methyltransferase MnmC [Nonlabens dokdonensis]
MITGDGSKTIHMPDLNEQYHSKHGALQEALHVFIETGLEYFVEVSLSQKRDFKKEPLHILEYGFGTGLNAMLTAQHKSNTFMEYTALEAFPIAAEEVEAIDYGKLLEDQELFAQLHNASWNKKTQISDSFFIEKIQTTFEKLDYDQKFDLIFFDAFGPRTQPELWTQPIFDAAFKSLKNGGVLTTYCAAGQVRRNMQSAGFTVERLPGPPGKREMLRASKEF